MTQPDPLTEFESTVLAFEAEPPRTAAAKEKAIRDRFDLSSTRYYQLLNALIDRRDAWERHPRVMARLNRTRRRRYRR